MAPPCLTQASCSFPLLFFNRPKTKTIISSSSYSTVHFHYPNNYRAKQPSSCFFSMSLPLSHSSDKKKTSSSTGFPTTVFALIDNQQFATTAFSEEEEEEGEEIEIVDDDGLASSAAGNQFKACELYVCNIPSGCDISQLLDIFKPFGTVQSVEVSRDAETGLSRGCGYVTMSSICEAKNAIASLDGSDVGGREMWVTFSVDVKNGRRNIDALNSTPKRDLIFESPYKVYAGNLAWSVKPEDLRNLFCQFGTVVSARVLQDRKGGKNRVYGFLSFSSAAELEAAMALNGTEYRGRKIILREVSKQNEP